MIGSIAFCRVMAMSKDSDSAFAEHLSDMSLGDEVEKPAVKSTCPRTKSFNFGPFTKPTNYGALHRRKHLHSRSISFPIDYSTTETVKPIDYSTIETVKPVRLHKPRYIETEPCKSQKIKLKKLAEDFTNKPNDELLKRFYITANQLLVHHETTKVCLLCLNKKETYPNSHIFPAALLKEYRKIHCKDDKSNMIWEIPSNKIKGIKELSYPLFCPKCETEACTEERFLKDVYIQIMGVGADEKHTLVIEKEESLNLRHILAILMFRGVLIGRNGKRQ